MSNLEGHEIDNNKCFDTESLTVRRAALRDIDGIMDVACSVGNQDKNHNSGFLMDDYVKEYDYFKDRFSMLIKELEHFYIAENTSIIGFLLAYERNEWLRYNPNWLDDIIWSPEFNMGSTNNFILVDKTAVYNGYTGKGIGSMLYRTLIHDISNKGIHDMFAETIISPKPNFASLEFRIKQKYKLAGIRYELYKDTVYTDLIYHKGI